MPWAPGLHQDQEAPVLDNSERPRILTHPLNNLGLCLDLRVVVVQIRDAPTFISLEVRCERRLTQHLVEDLIARVICVADLLREAQGLLPLAGFDMAPQIGGGRRVLSVEKPPHPVFGLAVGLRALEDVTTAPILVVNFWPWLEKRIYRCVPAAHEII